MAEPGTTSNGKPSLSRSLLIAHGILIEDDIADVTRREELPKHVECLKDALLDFDQLFEPECKPTLLRKDEAEAKRASHLPYPPLRDEYYLRPEIGHRNRLKKSRDFITEGELDDFSKLAEKFHDLAKRKCDEDKWTLLILRHFFHDFEDAVDAGKSYSRYGYLFDRWSCVFNYLWTGAINRDLEPDKKHPTRPKPDITFGFSMIEPGSSMPKGFWTDQIATNFHTTVLAKLLNTYHRTSLPRLKAEGNPENDLLCFPWAVVEIKRGYDSSAEFCYCQAANASSFALQLFDDLVFQATGQRDHTVPLVIAFTIVGPEYSVWIAYSSPAVSTKKCHRMRCIWRHSMATTWGLIALREIVMNMHTWAARILRPSVSNYISQCRTKLRLEGSLVSHAPTTSSSGNPGIAVTTAEPEVALASTLPMIDQTKHVETSNVPLSTPFSGEWPFPTNNQSGRNGENTRSSKPIFQFWPGFVTNLADDGLSSATSIGVASIASTLADSPGRQGRRYLKPRKPSTGHIATAPQISVGKASPLVFRPGEFEKPSTTPYAPLSSRAPICTPTVCGDAVNPFTTKEPRQAPDAAVRASMLKAILVSDDRSTDVICPRAEEPIRPKSSSLLEPPASRFEAQAGRRPRSSSISVTPIEFPQAIESVHVDYQSQDNEYPMSSNENGRTDEPLPDVYRYHEYRLPDQDTRWETAPWSRKMIPSLRYLEQFAKGKDHGSKDIENEYGVDTPQPLESHRFRDVHCGMPEPSVSRRLEKQAFKVLDGRETLQLKAVRMRIDSASGTSLLDMVMRALCYVRLHVWRWTILAPILAELNQFLMRFDDEALQLVDIRSEEAISLLRPELERVQIVRDRSGDGLRMLLRKCFAILDGVSCLEILKFIDIGMERAVTLFRLELEMTRDLSEAELRDLLEKCLAILNGKSIFEVLGIEQKKDPTIVNAEELAVMQKQALSIMLNSWTGESFEGGYCEATFSNNKDGLGADAMPGTDPWSNDEDWETIDDDSEGRDE